MNTKNAAALQPLAYTAEDAARVSAIGRTNIFGAIRRGELKARKFNSRTLILDEDLRAWLSSLPIAPASDGESRG
jgi:hypothetical protein